MAEGMMGRGPAPRGRLSDEQRAQIRQVRMEQGRGAARAMRRDMRREAGLPVRQRQNQMSEMAPPAQQSPMVMGQPTGDMMAFRPMPTEQPLPPMPAGNPFPQGPTQGVAQGIGAALGGAQQQPMPITDMMYRGPVNMTPEMQQAMQDRYAQMQMPMQQSVQPQFNANMPAMQPGMNTGVNPFYNRPLGMGAGIPNYFK